MIIERQELRDHLGLCLSYRVDTPTVIKAGSQLDSGAHRLRQHRPGQCICGQPLSMPGSDTLAPLPAATSTKPRGTDSFVDGRTSEPARTCGPASAHVIMWSRRRATRCRPIWPEGVPVGRGTAQSMGDGEDSLRSGGFV